MGSNLGNLEKLVLTTEAFLQTIKQEASTSQCDTRFLRIVDAKDHAQYPVPNKPEKVFLFSKDKGVIVDSDTYVNPYTAQCDAYVLTDKGIHLIYIKGSQNYHVSSFYNQFYSDPNYKLLNEKESEYPMFFISKVNKRKRVCVPTESKHGELFAAEYNFLVDQHLKLPF
jgi:hypothetical protein